MYAFEHFVGISFSGRFEKVKFYGPTEKSTELFVFRGNSDGFYFCHQRDVININIHRERERKGGRGTKRMRKREEPES